MRTIREIGIWGHDIVNGSNNLIHSLYVSLARIEFGIDKEYSLYNLPVRLLALLHGGIVLRRTLRDQVNLRKSAWV